MSDMTISLITVGNADKGGWWFSIGALRLFEDGFRTEDAAIAAATAAIPSSSPWEIYHACKSGSGRTMMVPGAKSENHPEILIGA